jgi:phosphoserine phosphatase RsbU/P
MRGSHFPDAISDYLRNDMTEISSILLVGLQNAEEAFAAAHFGLSGRHTTAVADLNSAFIKLKTQEIDAVYLRVPANAGLANQLEEALKPFNSLPIVFVLERHGEQIILDAWHAGAADVVFLPMAPQSLDSSLMRCIKRISSRKQERQSSTAQGRFFYLDESGKEHWAVIPGPHFTIGRSAHNDLVLNQAGVSRLHAEVSVENGEYYLQDLASKHGTFLNGIKAQRIKMTNGDRIQFGMQGISLVFHEGDLLQSLLIKSSHSRLESHLNVGGFKDIGMLFYVFQALSSTPVLDDLLALIVDTAIEMTATERGFIMLREAKGELIFRCARNRHKRSLNGSAFQTSRRVPHAVFHKGRSISINDLNLDDSSEDHSATRQLGLHSIYCVPLRYLPVCDSGNASEIMQEETIGVLYVDSPAIGEGPSGNKMRALETLASEAAMAIYNARLYRDSQAKRKMDEQLSVAREIQQALLPAPDRDDSYVNVRSLSLPCHQVGGDYFDYFEMKNNQFGFAIGDVSGKGMPAALLASLLQGILSAQTLTEDSLPALISRTNRNLSQRAANGRFVTLFFGVLDSDGNCTYVNAGHNPPFLLHPDGSMEELTEGGMVLGLFAGSQYNSGSVKLAPNDHLVLFTDGVIESFNAADEEFGLNRLTALLRTNAGKKTTVLLEQLQEAILSFSGQAPQHDDITIMILGFRES